MPHPRAPSHDLLGELGGSLAPELLEDILRAFPGGDASTERLRRATGAELDLSVSAHRVALLAWLRSWGCRHLRVADAGRSSRALARWWRAHGASLPTRELISLSARDLDAAAGAFDALAGSPAAWRAADAGPVSVSFGQTAAAKALFAIRPLAFAPWDEPIRRALGLAGGAGYRSYLERSAEALRALAARLRVPVSELPKALGRPGSSPPKLVDEYLWMRANATGPR